MADGEWYWCMDHQAAEPSPGDCPPDRRLGPYTSREEAVHWKDRVEARNEAWDKDDEDQD